MKQDLTPLVLTISICLFFACSQPAAKKVEKEKVDNMYSTTGDDTQMNSAMQAAGRRFGQFDSAFKSGKYDPLLFSIKVRYSYPRGNEYMWLVQVDFDKNEYSGLVSDTPRHPIHINLGDRVAIDQAKIVDWLYGKDSILHGGYTLRVITGRMSKEEREKHRAKFPYKIED
jgi:uncharacterized protein YegJ (DUF2314 family)